MRWWENPISVPLLRSPVPLLRSPVPLRRSPVTPSGISGALKSTEKNTQATGWMKFLSRALYDRVSKQNIEEMLFTSSELLQFTEEEERITPLSVKLDELAIALNLIPQAKKAPKTNLLPISQKQIQPVLVIFPRSVVCEDIDCKARSLVQKTKL